MIATSNTKARKESFSDTLSQVFHGDGDAGVGIDWNLQHETYSLSDTHILQEPGAFDDADEEEIEIEVEEDSAGAEESNPQAGAIPASTADGERIIRIEPYARWSEPIRHLAGTWQPTLMNLVQGRISEEQAEASMSGALDAYIFGRRDLPPERVATLARSIREILLLRKSVESRLRAGSQSPADILRSLRHMRREKGTFGSSGIYVAFASMVHDVYYTHHSRLHARSQADS